MSAKKHSDLLIFGGGVAGITAMIWAADLGLSAVVVDRFDILGGQLVNVFNAISNYPGARFRNGEEMREHLLLQTGSRVVDIMLEREVVNADLAKKTLTFNSGEAVSGNAILIATGVRRRRLNVKGEDRFAGAGILDSGAKDPARVSGKRVVIVGGGDAALENAIGLSQEAETVFLVHRRDEFSARTDFVAQVRSKTNIKVLFNAEVLEFVGTAKLEGVRILDRENGGEISIEVDHSLVRIGFLPNSELFQGQAACDERGYLLVDHDCRTDIDQVYAAGDVCRPLSQTIAGAVGDGATAVKCVAADQRRNNAWVR